MRARMPAEAGERAGPSPAARTSAAGRRRLAEALDGGLQIARAAFGERERGVGHAADLHPLLRAGGGDRALEVGARASASKRSEARAPRIAMRPTCIWSRPRAPRRSAVRVPGSPRGAPAAPSESGVVWVACGQYSMGRRAPGAPERGRMAATHSRAVGPLGSMPPEQQRRRRKDPSDRVSAAGRCAGCQRCDRGAGARWRLEGSSLQQEAEQESQRRNGADDADERPRRRRRPEWQLPHLILGAIGAALFVLLSGIAFVIVRDARRVAPAVDGEVTGSALHPRHGGDAPQAPRESESGAPAAQAQPGARKVAAEPAASAG